MGYFLSRMKLIKIIKNGSFGRFASALRFIQSDLFKQIDPKTITKISINMMKFSDR